MLLDTESSGKKKKDAHKLKKNPRDTSRVSGGTNRGLPAGRRQCAENKGMPLPGHRPGVPGRPGRRGGFSDQILCDLFLCAFPAPQSVPA